ncbi:MAG: stage II sporulation protein E [Gorillibacterium sp.]|nr:stage II sporulation protein E [Gorillibacterium sp.]
MEKTNLFHRCGVELNRSIQSLSQFGGSHAKGNKWLQVLSLRKWGMLLTVMAFLLGRASILDQLSPFALAYFAVIYYMRKDLVVWVGVAAAIGSFMSPLSQPVSVLSEMFVFLLLQKAMEKFEQTELSYVPFLVGASTFLVQLFIGLVSAGTGWFPIIMSVIDGLLATTLSLIFIQALPIFAPARKSIHLKNEEIVCLIILLASVMTGTVGWEIGGVSIQHLLSRYLVLIFALAGGAPLGASVGVVAGMILSLADANAVYQISLLAFSGLLAGLMKDGGKMPVVLGMLLGSSILSFYIGDQSAILISVWESAAAAVLFLISGGGLVRALSHYVPGTQENLNSQYEYAKRIRDITASRVERFSDVFRQLSRSFTQLAVEDSKEQRSADKEHFMQSIAQKACTSCFRSKTCWNEQFLETQRTLTEMMTAIEHNSKLDKRDLRPEWRHACKKTEQVLNLMKEQYGLYRNDLHWKQQIMESRQLVADQLVGVSQVMEDLANEIKREGQQLYMQEEQIRSALNELGLAVYSIDVINLEEGNVEIEIVHRYTRGFDECRKIIAPLLSDILGETITVKKEQVTEREDGSGLVTFGSAKEYEVETGVATAAKGGGLLSGDSYTSLELGNGKFAVALSDGMGNGERARQESSTALDILQKLLQSGMNEKLAIKSVNSVLLLRSLDEIYATVDLAIIDLYSAHTTFMKIGSIPSFIKRGSEVIPISASNLPVGILSEIDVDLVALQLQPGDILIMMTDGIYDAPGHAVNKELWLKRLILEISTEDPQEFADCLLERVVRYQQGQIDDDMTVIVSCVTRYQPEWSTFRWPGIHRIERPKIVS